MKTRMVEYYMDLARRTAALSRAEKLKVGSVIVTTDDAILYGWNGTPAGWDNTCEYEVEELVSEYGVGTRLEKTGELKTFDYVLHAEMNALSKLARSTLSGRGASLFLTHSPCIHCAKAVYQAGIENVFYLEEYRSHDGVLFLQQCGINIQRVE